MPDHSPPSSNPLAAVSMVPYPYGGASIPSWRLELSLFTRAMLCEPGADKLDNSESTPLHEPLSTIPLGNLAHWILGDPQEQWFDYGVKVQTQEGRQTTTRLRFVQDVVDILREHPGNTDLSEALKAKEIATSLPGDDGASTYPVVLFLQQERGEKLEKWFKARKREARRAFIAEECAELRATLGRMLDDLESAYGTRKAVIETLNPLMTKLQAGEQIIKITEAFGRPFHERPNRSPWKEAGRLAFVVPAPDASWRERLRSFRTAEWSVPLDVCHQMIEHPEINRELNNAADAFVAELRTEGSPYLDYLDRYDDLHPGSRAELRATIRRGVELCMLCESARDALLEGELNTILRLVVEAKTPSGPGGSNSARSRSVEDFSFGWLNPADDTPLGKKIAESWTGEISDSLDRGTFVVSLLAKGTAAFALKAKKTGLVEGDIFALLYRQFVSIADLSAAQESDFGAALSDFSETKDFKKIERFLFNERTGLVAPAVKYSTTALQSATLLCRLILLRHSLSEAIAAPPGSEAQLAWLKTTGGVVEVAGAGADLAKMLKDTALVTKAADALGFNPAQIGPAATCLGFVADLLTFVISATESGEAMRTTRTDKFRDEKLYTAVYDGAKVIATSLALVFGWEVAVIGFAIMGLKYAATHVDSWVPYVPFAPTDPKPAPHKILESLLHEMVNEDKHEFWKVIKKAKRIGPVKELAEDLEDQTIVLLNRLENGVPDDIPVFWDLAPPRSKDSDDYYAAEQDTRRLHTVKQIIRQEWGGYDNATLDKLVRHCSH